MQSNNHLCFGVRQSRHNSWKGFSAIMPNFHKQRVIGRVFRGLIVLLVLAINAVLVWRVFFSAQTPKAIATLQANEVLVSAYEEQGNSLTLRYQDQASITRAEGNYGYFSVTQCVFIPEAQQVQIVVRYNNSTIRHLAEDFTLAEVPERENHLFDVTLVKTTDLTPNDSTDNTSIEALSSTRYAPNADYLCDYTALYTYYRYTFDNVTVDDLTVGVFVDIFYVDAIDYNAEAYGTLCIYSDDCEWLSYSLTSADKAALHAWREGN